MDFADILTPSGRRIAEGRDLTVGGALADPAQPFLSLAGVVEQEAATKLMAVLDCHVFDVLPEVGHPLPDALRGLKKN